MNGENTDSITVILECFSLKTQFQSLYILQNSLKGRSDIFSTVLKVLNTELKSSLTETKASLHSCMISAAKAGWWLKHYYTTGTKHIQYHNTKQKCFTPKEIKQVTKCGEFSRQNCITSNILNRHFLSHCNYLKHLKTNIKLSLLVSYWCDFCL